MVHLSENVKVTTVAPTATGTTTITSSAIDMTGYEGAMIIVRLGSPATNNSVKVQQCDTSGGTYADLTGSSVGSHATDNPLIIDMKPQKQFLKYVVTRGTTTTIDAVTIIQYGANARPVTQPSGTQTERWNWPAEGTA